MCQRQALPADSVSDVTEDEAREIAETVLRARLPEFDAGRWVLTAIEEYDTAWTFSYNSRLFIQTHELIHSLAGNSPLVVPKSGAEPWFAWSGAPTADQVAQGRSALDP